MTRPPDEEKQPLRVSTLELFFDLVFVFTITQLTGMLSDNLNAGGMLRVLLVFGVLWWMYGGYAWLTNARTPSELPERLLLLLGMAGFLAIGLAIPHAFARRGEAIALGLGYLLVVAVHGALYLRRNRNILRVVPFNVASALLVIAAGVAGISGGHENTLGYVLWVLALAVQALSPLLIKPHGRFSIQPSHFVERHGALIIVAFGESVADVGVGAAEHPNTFALVVQATLGLALAAALWWAYFGVGDDDRAEEAMTGADPAAPARAGAERVLLLLHPDAARHLDPGRRDQAGDRRARLDRTLPGLPGAGRRGGALPGRGHRVPACAVHRRAPIWRARVWQVPLWQVRLWQVRLWQARLWQARV